MVSFRLFCGFSSYALPASIVLAAGSESTCGAEEVCVNDDHGVNGRSHLQVSRTVEADAKSVCECSAEFDAAFNAEREGHQAALSEISDEKVCEIFCQDTKCPCLKPWSVRCSIRSCAGCPACGDEPPPAPPPVPPPVDPCRPDGSKFLFCGSQVLNDIGSKRNPRLIYKDIRQGNGKPLDLIITPSESTPWSGKKEKCGLNGPKRVSVEHCMGMINIDSGKEVEFTFQFVEAGTETMVEVRDLNLEFYDIDMSYENDDESQGPKFIETVKFLTPVSEVHAGEKLSMEGNMHDGSLRVTATTKVENPDWHITTLNAPQRAVSVRVKYAKTGEFRISFGSYSPNREKGGGRNIFFGASLGWC